jgi:hypothetical protein
MFPFMQLSPGETREEAAVTKVRSHTRHEQQLRKDFRAKLNTSESSEDVRKFFVNAFRELMNLTFENEVEVRNDDVSLDSDAEHGYRISSRLMNNRLFREEWDASDLSSIVCRLAESARKRIVRFDKNLDKTESKIFRDNDFGRCAPARR